MLVIVIMRSLQGRLTLGSSISLRRERCKRSGRLAYLRQHFPLGKSHHPLISPAFVIGNPWIVPVAI